MKTQSRVLRYFWASALCLACVAFSFSQLETARAASDDPCVRTAESALIRAARHQQVDPQELKDCRGDIRRLPEDGQSVPVMATAAMVLSGHQDAKVLLSYYRGEWLERELDLQSYRGLFVHAAGPRSAVDQAHGVETSSFHGLLSAALDWPWTPRQPLERASPEGQDWPLALAVELAGDKTQDTAANLWGLTRSERDALRAYVDKPTARGAAQLIRWLKPYTAPATVTMTWIRYQDGRVVTVMSRVRDEQGEGPWLIAAGIPGRAWRIQARRATVEGDHVLAWDRSRDDGVGLPDFGRELFRIVWDRRGWRVKTP